MLGIQPMLINWLVEFYLLVSFGVALSMGILISYDDLCDCEVVTANPTPLCLVSSQGLPLAHRTAVLSLLRAPRGCL